MGQPADPTNPSDPGWVFSSTFVHGFEMTADIDLGQLDDSKPVIVGISSNTNNTTVGFALFFDQPIDADRLEAAGDSDDASATATILVAPPVGGGFSYMDRLAMGGTLPDQDFFTIAVPAGKILRVSGIFGQGAGFGDLTLELRNSGGDILLDSTSAPFTKLVHTNTTATEETISIHISSASGDAFVLGYEINN